MKKTHYFSHDGDTRKDIKIRELMCAYGYEGYGWFWALIEIMCKCKGYKLKLDKASILYYATECNCTLEKMMSFINDCIKAEDEDGFELFNSDGTNFWSIKDFKIKKYNNPLNRLCNVNANLWYEIRKKIFYRDNYTCFYCGKMGGKLEVDHKIPVIKGGSDNFTNLVTACRTCNRKKRDKTSEEFLLWKDKN